MANQQGIEAELATVRRQLAEATAAIGTQKKQLADAKAKAKAIIQRKMNEADAKVKLLDEQTKLQAEELSKLKPMLREIDDERTKLSGECENLSAGLEQSQAENAQLKSSCTSLENELASLKSLRASENLALLKAQGGEAEGQLEKFQSLRSAKEELTPHPTTPQVNTSDAEATPNDDGHSDSQIEVKGVSQSEAQLRIECENLRTEVQSLRRYKEERSGHTQANALESPSKVDAIWEETRKSKELVSSLSKELEEARINTEAKSAEYENAIHESELKKSLLQDQLDATKARVTELERDVQKSEMALQEEREKFIQERNSSKGSSATDAVERNKILEAKVSEMERVVASKQAEIGKVREKAKTYLRELNAEKRAMEAKMKEEAGSLQKELEEERGKVVAADQRADSASAEVDNCLALIRDKQKSLQMLKMTISTQRSTAEEATRETESLRAEFARYKERARLALQEKDTAAESVESAVAAATTALRRSLDKAQKEVNRLKSRLQQFEDMERRYKDVLERAQRAEAAADLLRNDNSQVSNENYRQVDILEEKLTRVEAERNAARDTVEDVEAQLETTRMRLEATDKALRGAEVRAVESERVAQKTCDGLRGRVESLEQELARAQESAAAAQRTAAAAAKALSFSGSDSKEENLNTKSQPDVQREEGRRGVGDVTNFGSRNRIDGGRSILAAALEGHSDTFSVREFDAQSNRGPLIESELKMKEQQIVILTAQIAEVGTLLDDVQHEAELRAEQTALLKEEVKNLDAKLAAAEKLQNGAPFSYLRTIVVRYLETDDSTLLPVIASVLSFTEEENGRVKSRRGTTAAPGASPKSGYFGLPLNGLLGNR